MKLKLFLLFTVNFFSILIYSQKAEDIQTQEITVEKSFNPKVEIAKKIKSKIIISDTLTSKIEDPEILITSVPVASTFDPSKGTPKKLEILPAKENFNSRFALGFGNYNNLILDYGSSVSLDKRQNVDWFIFYDGLLKNINNSFVDTKQSNLNLNISHQLLNIPLKLFVHATNVLNTDYVEIDGYATKGRNLIAGISYELP